MIAIALILLAWSAQTKFGLFGRFNFATAYMDRWNGKERIIIFGEPFETDSIKSATAPRLGFTYERLEDCTVTTSFVNGVTDYNSIMSDAINNRLGENWNDRLEREIADIKAQGKE